MFEVMLQEVCEICQWSVEQESGKQEGEKQEGEEQEGEERRERWTPKLIKQVDIA